ncbi:hypothetical protein G6O69_16450 [Pseudenhygromyxa sp. WMMC2535]|uniref:hypothetical protein n=1 Tax=Pseudenhygromyxa sp. WMMC2535 TaxID=2712867 RepID=UPI0015579DF8|nr:hypothetical protein [Pseudenhygromyxa sp. WMMC2535]NVB39434.1 hypothetical protein [Pseudenhygromyxa sp. WMMC2535]
MRAKGPQPTTSSPLVRERQALWRRRLFWLGLGLGLIGLAAALWWQFGREPAAQLPPLETRLPEFEEPEQALARAPSSAALGARVGFDDLESLRRALAARGLDCVDTSARASVARLREHKREQIAAAGDPDAVSGASVVWRRSSRESNPQIRLACTLETLAALDDASRPPVEGRALFVFDSPEHPLRHASLRRSYRQAEAAMLDLRETLARLEATYGEPSVRSGELPLPGDAPPRLEAIRVEWRYRDLLVRASATQIGEQVSVDERVEVPWPVRADAPQAG